MRITKGVKPKPRNTILFGGGGVGKTTAAASWPNPILLDIEGGSNDVDIARSDRIESFGDFQRDVGWLLSNDHGFLTAAVDSVDWLEKLVHTYVADVKGVQSFADFDYGKGYNKSFDQFQGLINAMRMLNARGIGCLLICHADATKHSPPGEQSYERWEPALHEKVRDLLFEFVDEVFFLKKEEFSTTEDMGFNKTRRMAKTTQQRILVCNDTGSVRAKNRLSMPDEVIIPQGASVFSVYLEYIKQNMQRAKSEVVFDSSAPVKQPEQEQPKQEAPTPQGGNIAGIVVDGSSKRPADSTNTDAIGDEMVAMMAGGK